MQALQVSSRPFFVAKDTKRGKDLWLSDRDMYIDRI